MPDYRAAKIYIIRSDLTEKVYVGATTKSLDARMAQHRYEANKRSSPLYDAMNRHGHENFRIELIRDAPCESLQQLNAIEGAEIRARCMNGLGFNTIIKGRSKEQYYRDERPNKIRYQTDYYERHREARLEYQYRYRQARDAARQEILNAIVEDAGPAAGAEGQGPGHPAVENVV